MSAANFADDRLLTLRELSKYSGLSRSTLHRYMTLPGERALPVYRLSRRAVRVRRSTFDAWIEAFKVQGAPEVIRHLRAMGLVSDS